MHSLRVFLWLVPLLFISSTGLLQAQQLLSEQRTAKDLARDKLSKGPAIVDMVVIEEGMHVLDVFGGGGYYSELLSSKVGAEGQVFLHNNQAYMPYVEHELLARLEGNRLRNVKRWDKEADNLMLKQQSFDAIFFVLGYHDLYHTTQGWQIDKDKFLKQIVAALKVGARLLIVDHSAVAGSGTQYAQDLHRIDVDYVQKELEGYGLSLLKTSNLLANPRDSRMTSPFNKDMRRKTDRFILLFEKL